MTPTPRKKLIEVALPLEAINVASAREKVDPRTATRARCTCGGRAARWPPPRGHLHLAGG